MKIVVCIKQVPDTTEIKLDPATGTMIRDGVPSIMNPDDKGGLEMALALKDKYGAQVTVITMGPPQADDILREAFAMGADRAIHLSDRKFAGADTLATSNAIAGALRMLDFDLVITGRQAIDGDTAQVGPQIAEHLGWPQITYAVELKKDDKDVFTVKRQFEDQAHMLKVKTPCLITALSELNEARYMSVGGIFECYNKPLEVYNFETLKDDPLIELDTIGLKGSPTNVYKSFSPPQKGAGMMLEGADKATCEKLVSLLAEKHII